MIGVDRSPFARVSSSHTASATMNVCMLSLFPLSEFENLGKDVKYFDCADVTSVYSDRGTEDNWKSSDKLPGDRIEVPI